MWADLITRRPILITLLHPLPQIFTKRKKLDYNLVGRVCRIFFQKWKFSFQVDYGHFSCRDKNSFQINLHYQVSHYALDFFMNFLMLGEVCTWTRGIKQNSKGTIVLMISRSRLPSLMKVAKKPPMTTQMISSTQVAKSPTRLMAFLLFLALMTLAPVQVFKL